MVIIIYVETGYLIGCKSRTVNVSAKYESERHLYSRGATRSTTNVASYKPTVEYNLLQLNQRAFLPVQ
jgi:hypothetical protein